MCVSHSLLRHPADKKAQFDSNELANAPGLDLLNADAEGKELPKNFGHIDYQLVTAIDMTKGTLPSLVSPNTRPNVLFAPDRRLNSIAAAFYRSEALGPGYTVNYKTIYFACAAIAAGEAVPLPCTVSFQRDYNGDILSFTSPGDGTMSQAVLNFKDAYSLSVRITDLGPLANLLTNRASLFLDSFTYAINPNPPPPRVIESPGSVKRSKVQVTS
jgi:hypothetical protein